MAECGKIYKGQDLSCGILQKGYHQDVVLINYDDLDTMTVDVDCAEETSKYGVQFTLKEGAKGVLFKGPAAGNSVKGFFSMARNDHQVPEYNHQVQMLLSGVNQDQKCILHNLDKGRVFAAIRIRKPNEDEQIEIYGIGEGMISADYNYDVVESGGIVPITLNSTEGAFEDDLPYIYESANDGDPLLDYEALFENQE